MRFSTAPDRRHKPEWPPVSSNVRYAAGPGGGGTGRPPPTSTTSQSQETHRAHESLRESIEHTVRDTMRSATMRRFTNGVAVFAVLSALTWFFWDFLRPQFSRPVGEVATEALNVPEFQVSAEELSKEIVKQVLFDDEIRERASHFVEDLLSREATRRALTDVVIRSLKSEEFRQNANQFSKELVLTLLADPTMKAQFEALVGYAISTEGNKERWIQLLKNTAADDSFRASVNQLTAHTVHRLLNDKNVEKHAQTFVEDLLSDSALQAEGGNALWSMVKSAVTPAFLQTSSSSSPIAPPPPQRKEERRSSGTVIHPEAFNSSFSEYSTDQDEIESEDESDLGDGLSSGSHEYVDTQSSRSPEVNASPEANLSSTEDSVSIATASSSRDSGLYVSPMPSAQVDTDDSTSSEEVIVNPEQSEMSVLAFASSNEESMQSPYDDSAPSSSSVSADFLSASSSSSTFSDISLALPIPTESPESTNISDFD